MAQQDHGKAPEFRDYKGRIRDRLFGNMMLLVSMVFLVPSLRLLLLLFIGIPSDVVGLTW